MCYSWLQQNLSKCTPSVCETSCGVTTTGRICQAFHCASVKNCRQHQRFNGEEVETPVHFFLRAQGTRQSSCLHATLLPRTRVVTNQDPEDYLQRIHIPRSPNATIPDTRSNFQTAEAYNATGQNRPHVLVKHVQWEQMEKHPN